MDEKGDLQKKELTVEQQLVIKIELINRVNTIQSIFDILITNNPKYNEGVEDLIEAVKLALHNLYQDTLTNYSKLEKEYSRRIFVNNE